MPLPVSLYIKCFNVSYSKFSDIQFNLTLCALNLTSHKIIFFTSYGKNPKNLEEKLALNQQSSFMSHQIADYNEVNGCKS